MSNQRSKYVRVLIDVEVEVLNDAAISDPHDNLDLPDFPGSAQGYDVGRVLTEAIYGITPDTGIRVMASSVMPRRKTEDGKEYPAFTWPPIPTRGDDGKLSDED